MLRREEEQAYLLIQKMASILPIACFFFFFLASSSTAINIRDYGAVPDGTKGSTKALQNAWNTACAAATNARIEIPMGRYLIGPVIFKGPCKSPVTIHMIGTLIAKKNLALYKPNWIEFQYINGLILYGPGKVDGQGADAWMKNNCRQNHKSDCRPFPMNMVFSFVSNANISRISSINSKYFHMLIFGSNNMIFDSITITAPGNSPNTDGIHIAVSQNIIVQNSIIGTGDDCISIGDKTLNLTISGVRCGPGHGISIGSLGRNINEEDVAGLTIRNCSFRDTQNGVRIKTWQNGPKELHVRDLVFEDIRMENVENPIVIDQKYCPSRTCPDNLRPSRVKIRNVKFNNIVGTSTSQLAIRLVCSASNPCEEVELNHIDLGFNGVGEAKASCVNVKAPKVIDIVKPKNCA